MDDKERPSAKQLLEHQWFKSHKNVSLKQKWPWLVRIHENDDNNLDDEKHDDMNGSEKRRKRLSFGQYFRKNVNEDLLFMISALIIRYSKQNIVFDAALTKSEHLHRRLPNHSFSDNERIENMARYALCSKQMVIERIQTTVAHIKSNLNKNEISRIDS